MSYGEYPTHREVHDLIEKAFGESYAHPKELECPVCNHVTLSRATYEGKGKSYRYCYGCGKKFSKQTTWNTVDSEGDPQ